MQYKDYTKYYPFAFVGLIGLAMLISAISMTYVFVGINDVQPNNETEILEVKLPIMSWSQYSMLSKKYEDGIVSSDKKLMDGEKTNEAKSTDAEITDIETKTETVTENKLAVETKPEIKTEPETGTKLKK